MNIHEENVIIEQTKKDPTAFGPIFDKYYSPIFRYVLHRTGNAAVAADITSETFFKALNKIHSYSYKGYSISSWLYKIAGNEANSFFRKKKYEPVSYEASAGDETVRDLKALDNIEHELVNAQETIEKQEKYQEIREVMSKLNSKYQEVIVLRFFEDLKISEIAEITGKNEGTVKSLLSRGLSSVRKELEKQGTENE